MLQLVKGLSHYTHNHFQESEHKHTTSGTNHFIFAHFFVRVETAATIEKGKRGTKNNNKNIDPESGIMNHETMHSEHRQNHNKPQESLQQHIDENHKFI
jgi:hypothetical protein